MADTNLLILAREFKKLRTHVQEVLKMPVGPQGLQGETGEQGVKGDTGAPGKDGKDGKDGVNGLNGQDGRNGVDGNDGKDGLDGVGVQNAYIDFDNSLVIVLTNGQEINAGFLSQETKDAVVATFKQGAQTLNELLPVQIGNANKFLKTDGENVSWDTLDGSDIDLESPPVIGSTTPNAATFTTLTSNGLTTLTNGSGSLIIDDGGGSIANFRLIGPTASLGRTRLYSPNQLRISTATTNSINFYTGASSTPSGDGVLQLQVSNTSSAVNYVQVTGAATAGNVAISSQGSDNSVSIQYQAKGGGAHRFITNTTLEQFRVGHATSSVNYLLATGSATGNGLQFSAQGTDTNISQVFQSKGTGAIDLAAGSSGVNISNGGTVTAITRTAGGGSYTSTPTVVISAPTTAGGVQATATVTVSTTGTPTIVSGGTGYTVGDVLSIVGGTPVSVAATMTVTSVSGGVVTAASYTNFAQYTTPPTGTISVTGGTGSGATFNISFAVTTAFTITNAGSGYVEQPTVTFSGGGGSGAAAYASVGSGTTIKSLHPDFFIAGPASSTNIFRFGSVGNAVNNLFTYNNTTGASPVLRSIGSDTNVGVDISSQGTGNIRFLTNAVNQEQLRVAHTASAVNYVQVTGAATTGLPQITAQGSDTNPGLLYITKGVGEHRFASNASAANIQFRIPHTASAVNYGTVTGAAAGASPVFGVLGSDTNIDLALTPKGTGNVRFGTYTGTILTPTGYVEIKDAGGTIRRLLVG